MPKRKIVFVTGNAGKFATASEHLAPLGVELEQVKLDLDEIQSTCVEDVAMHKAQQAFRLLERPLFVEDSGFGIDELGGYPGPMVKHLLAVVGASGIVRMADLTETRSARFVSTLVYIDAHGVPRVFVDAGEPGTIADEPMSSNEADAWSELWTIFVPPGCSATLSALPADERGRLFADWSKESIFARFGAWLTRRERAAGEPSLNGRMRSDELHFDFPADRIAARPRPAGTDRLVVVDRATSQITHEMFDDLPELLPAGSLIVVNNSAVVRAALRCVPDDGTYLHVTSPFHTDLVGVVCLCPWKPKVGASVAVRGGRFRVEGIPEPGRDLRSGAIVPDDPGITTLTDFMARHGEVPIPIYVNAQRDPDLADVTDYQNVYACVPGSVACATAGLHLSEQRIKLLEEAGHDLVEITLHIGYGTWKSLAAAYVDDHVMDAECCEINAQALTAIRAAKRAGRPVVAVGTSSVRALETFADEIFGEAAGPLRRETELYVSPGYEFRVVDHMVTNFAYPQTPIMAMAAAFTGSFELLRSAYQRAVDCGDYLFLTYGDALFLR
ncbi:MAG: non-canonical purine NTP pyrophosphatase [Egibacteraceae bacterium]